MKRDGKNPQNRVDPLPPRDPCTHCPHGVPYETLCQRDRGKDKTGAYTIGPMVRFYDDCTFCDQEKAKNSSMFPPHVASRSCESGKEPHCTCDTCW